MKTKDQTEGGNLWEKKASLPAQVGFEGHKSADCTNQVPVDAHEEGSMRGRRTFPPHKRPASKAQQHFPSATPFVIAINNPTHALT